MNKCDICGQAQKKKLVECASCDKKICQVCTAMVDTEPEVNAEGTGYITIAYFCCIDCFCPIDELSIKSL